MNINTNNTNNINNNTNNINNNTNNINNNTNNINNINNNTNNINNIHNNINNLYLYIKGIPFLTALKFFSYFIIRLIFCFISLFWLLGHFLLFKNI